MEVGKGNLLCFARGHILQSKVLLLLHWITSGTKECNKASLCAEGWPNLQCQRLELFMTEAALQVCTETPKLRGENLEMMSRTDCGRMVENVGCRV